MNLSVATVTLKQLSLSRYKWFLCVSSVQYKLCISYFILHLSCKYIFPSHPEIVIIDFHLSRKPQGLKARNHQHCTGEIRPKKLGFPKQANTSSHLIWMQMCFILSFRLYWQCWKQEGVKTQTPNFPPLRAIWCSFGKLEVSDFIHSADLQLSGYFSAQLWRQLYKKCVASIKPATDVILLW